LRSDKEFNKSGAGADSDAEERERGCRAGQKYDI
jgi:hypothetical protein